MSKKKKIIILISAILFAAILATSLSLYFVYRSKGPFSGTVRDTLGAPIANVSVSDGRNVVRTGADGTFELKGYHNSRFVTVTLPSGYNSDEFYMPVDGDRDTYNFTLTKVDNSEITDSHNFLQITDTEINEKGVGDWIEHLHKTVDETKPEFIVHTGDLCYEAGLKQHIKDMNSENMGVPVRYLIGNHDYIEDGGDELFMKIYGPTFYSFDVGNIHYVTTPYGKWSDYKSQYNLNDHWKWLANDLANVAPDKKVIMLTHNNSPSDDYVIKYGTKKLDLKDNNLIAWIYGHHHYNYVNMSHGVLNVSTNKPEGGGIDSSLSGIREISIDKDFNIETQMHYYDFDEPLNTPDNIWINDTLNGNGLFADTLVNGDVAYIATADDDWPRKCGVYAIDAKSGASLWYYSTENSIKNNLVLVNGKIIAQDASGKVYCLSAKDGKEMWTRQVEVGKPLSTSSGIVAEGNTVYAGSAGAVTALKVDSGDVIWSNTDIGGESSPSEFIIVGNKIIVGSHWNALVALDKLSGKQLWSNDTSPLSNRSSTPTLIDSSTMLVADSDTIMHVDVNSGEIKHRITLKDYSFSSSGKPLIKDNTAYVPTSNKGIIAYDIAARKFLWNVSTDKSLIYTAPYTTGSSASVESSIILHDSHLIFGASDGYLYQVNPSNGSIASKINVGSPIFGKAAIHSGDIIITDFSGRIMKISI